MSNQRHSDAILIKLDDCIDFLRVAIKASDNRKCASERNPICTLLNHVEKQMEAISIEIDEAFNALKNKGASL